MRDSDQDPEAVIPWQGLPFYYHCRELGLSHHDSCVRVFDLLVHLGLAQDDRDPKDVDVVIGGRS